MWPSSKQLKFELSSWLKPFLTFSKKDRDRFKRKSIQKNEKNKLRTHKNVTENEFCFVEVTYDGLFIFQNSPKLILQSQDELRNLFKLTLLLRPFSGSSNWEFELSEKQTKQNRDVLEPFSAENLTLSRNANVSHSNRQLELRIVWENLRNHAETFCWLIANFHVFSSSVAVTFTRFSETILFRKFSHSSQANDFSSQKCQHLTKLICSFRVLWENAGMLTSRNCLLSGEVDVVLTRRPTSSGMRNWEKIIFSSKLSSGRQEK